jgi:hypothetical protein
MITCIQPTDHTLSLRSAILLYGAGPQQVGYAALHRVVDGAIDPAAQPLALKALRALNNGLTLGLQAAEKRASVAVVWPDSVLNRDTSEGDSRTLWYLPQCQHLQIFDYEGTGQRKAQLNLPTLIFYQSGAALSICAIQGTSRPSDTGVPCPDV